MREVTPEDIDDMGHVNSVAFLRYFEDCTRAHAEAVGLTLEAFRAAGAVAIVREHRVVYHQQAELGEQLSVSTEVLELSGAKALRRNRATREGELLAECLTTWVWLGPKSGKPKRVPRAIKKAFGFGKARTEG